MSENEFWHLEEETRGRHEKRLLVSEEAQDFLG